MAISFSKETTQVESSVTFSHQSPTPASDAIKPLSVPLLDLMPSACVTVGSKKATRASPGDDLDETVPLLHHNQRNNNKASTNVVNVVLENAGRSDRTKDGANGNGVSNSSRKASGVSSGSPVQTNPPNSPSGVVHHHGHVGHGQTHGHHGVDQDVVSPSTADEKAVTLSRDGTTSSKRSKVTKHEFFQTTSSIHGMDVIPIHVLCPL